MGNCDREKIIKAYEGMKELNYLEWTKLKEAVEEKFHWEIVTVSNRLPMPSPDEFAKYLDV